MQTLEELKQELAKTIRRYNSEGWSPATSTNYSFRQSQDSEIWVSRSGVDKSEFSENDFITVNMQGIANGDFAHIKPSAETLIHTTLYNLFPETRCILHSHSVFPVVLSQACGDNVMFEGYEIQKGFAGQSTHDNAVEIPIFNNTQDMEEFADELMRNKDLLANHCFIMRKHGTYAWGTSLFEAKRHLETLEYLCKCKWLGRK